MFFQDLVIPRVPITLLSEWSINQILECVSSLIFLNIQLLLDALKYSWYLLKHTYINFPAISCGRTKQALCTVLRTDGFASYFLFPLIQPFDETVHILKLKIT